MVSPKKNQSNNLAKRLHTNNQKKHIDCLINIKNKHQRCFLWCHVRHINTVKVHLERITREDKKHAKDLDYDGIKFPVRERDFDKIEGKTIFVLPCLVTKID